MLLVVHAKHNRAVDAEFQQQYIQKTLESNKSASKVTEDASKEKDPSKAKKAEDPSKTAEELWLPRVVLSVVLPDKHESRYLTYNLKFSQKLKAAAAKKAEKIYVSRLEGHLEKKMREKTIVKLRERIVKDAKHKIRSQLRAEILNHEMIKYKD